MHRGLVEDVVAHHLALFGIDRGRRVRVVAAPDASTLVSLAVGHGATGCLVAVQPDDGALAVLGLTHDGPEAPPCRMLGRFGPAGVPRTLHRVRCHRAVIGSVACRTEDGRACWSWARIGSTPVLVVGTDLGGDLVRFRQGDPGQVANRNHEMKWGIAGERPNYLFDEQIAAESGCVRQADVWIATLVDAIRLGTGIVPSPILPGGVPGAVVITGDDDQAFLEKYDEQLALLSGLPVTYLLHPKTRHTPKTIASLRRRSPAVEFGIHPDALDAPGRYPELLDDQVRWYRQLIGEGPRCVRNHGYLNDGYWGHLRPWIANGIRCSSNIPGVDGRIVNGSLLPARVVEGGRLSEHWSILTAVGDGMVFALGMSDAEAAARVLGIGSAVRASGIPGVLVLNLHPQNVSETARMHEAARSLVEDGFAAWTLGQCIEWFAGRDRSGGEAP